MKNCFNLLFFMALPVVSSNLYAQIPDRFVVFPFPDTLITLSGGTPWKVAETRVSNALTAINVKNFLYNFRVTYGLPTTGYGTCGVWEAPDCNLRGHATGHVLSALSLNYAVTRNAAIKAKIRQLVDGLDTCQRLTVSKGMSAGCLSAFGESLFTALENGGTYGGNPNVWAPWYSQHKILAGLISCYVDAGDTVALRVAKTMANWAYNRLRKVSPNTLQSMWTRFCAGEYGGYNESATELYMITGDTTYRALAKFFDETTSGISLGNLAANKDNLGGQHANQLIPRVTGYLRIYDATGVSTYLNAAVNFWDMMDGHHRFGFGGVSTTESILGKDAIYANIQVARSNETCPTYNLVKLSKALFWHYPLAKYMDYWERANSAQLLANANVSGVVPTATQPFAAYMTNVKCGESKAASSSGDSYDIGSLYNFTCCDGTGLESHVRYGEGIFGHADDTLYVNQFTASTLNWVEKAKIVTILTAYPVSDTVTISVSGGGYISVKIRSPWWVRRPIQIWVNGTQRHLGKIPPATYFTIDATRGWSGSGTIKLVMPKTLRVETCADRTTVGTVFYGGMNVYGATTNTAFQSLDCGTFQKGVGLTWTASGFTFKPFYNVASDHYSLYWNVTNIPSAWLDTILDVADDAPAAIKRGASAENRLSVVTSISWTTRNGIGISFSSPVRKDLPVILTLFNARGVFVMKFKGLVSAGNRHAVFPIKKGIAAGCSIVDVKAGGGEYRAALVSGTN